MSAYEEKRRDRFRAEAKFVNETGNTKMNVQEALKHVEQNRGEVLFYTSGLDGKDRQIQMDSDGVLRGFDTTEEEFKPVRKTWKHIHSGRDFIKASERLPAKVLEAANRLGLSYGVTQPNVRAFARAILDAAAE